MLRFEDFPDWAKKLLLSGEYFPLIRTVEFTDADNPQQISFDADTIIYGITGVVHSTSATENAYDNLVLFIDGQGFKKITKEFITFTNLFQERNRHGGFRLLTPIFKNQTEVMILEPRWIGSNSADFKRAFVSFLTYQKMTDLPSEQVNNIPAKVREMLASSLYAPLVIQKAFEGPQSRKIDVDANSIIYKITGSAVNDDPANENPYDLTTVSIEFRSLKKLTRERTAFGNLFQERNSYGGLALPLPILRKFPETVFVKVAYAGSANLVNAQIALHTYIRMTD